MKLKKLISLFLGCVLAVSLSVTSFAANPNYMEQIEHQVALANARIDKMVAHAQSTKKDDVDELLVKVDKIVAQVRAKADKYGVEIACVYVEYEIDGRTVLIDPLMVVHV